MGRINKDYRRCSMTSRTEKKKKQSERKEKMKPCVYTINTSLDVRPFPAQLSDQEILVSAEVLTS